MTDHRTSLDAALARTKPAGGEVPAVSDGAASPVGGDVEHTAESDAWVDRQGDVWALGPDGLMHTPETAPFTREHVEKKWGPLRPVARLTSACACGDCYHPVIGPNTDGEPCDYCRDSTFLVRAGESEDEYRERVVREVAAHDAQVAAAAEAAAEERIAKAIKAASVPREGGLDVEIGHGEGLRHVARIARADRGGDRG